MPQYSARLSNSPAVVEDGKGCSAVRLSRVGQFGFNGKINDERRRLCKVRRQYRAMSAHGRLCRRRIALPYESRTGEVSQDLNSYPVGPGRRKIGRDPPYRAPDERSDRTKVGEKLHLIRGMRVYTPAKGAERANEPEARTRRIAACAPRTCL
jgi:hypothetical protein